MTRAVSNRLPSSAWTYKRAEKATAKSSEIQWDWRLIIVQALLLIAIVEVQSIATGLVIGFLLYRNWAKSWGKREAVVGIFVLACVLASSREGGLQYWKNLRLVPAAMVFLEALKVFREAPTEERRTLLRWVGVIVFCTGLPAVLSSEPFAGLFEVVLLSSLWFAMLTIARLRSRDVMKQRERAILHVGLTVVLASLFYFLMNSSVGFLAGRFRGIFGNPNEFSHWFLMVFIVGFVHNRRLTDRKAILFAVLTAFLFGLSGTRGAAVASAFVFLGFVLVQYKWPSGLRTMVALGSTILLVGLQTLDVSSFEAYLPERLVRAENLEEGGGRFLAWRYALEEIEKEPLFGHGGGYEQRYFASRYKFFAAQNHQGMSHNSWLAFAMDYGVVGSLALILGLLGRLRLFQSRYRWIVVPAMVFSFTFEGWLVAPMSASSPMLFFVGGWIGAFQR